MAPNIFIIITALSSLHTKVCLCRNSSVGIATRYGMDGPGIDSRWGRDFPHPCTPALGPTHPSVRRVTSQFPASKAFLAWPWASHTTTAAEDKERVQLYLYSPFWAWSRVNFAFTKMCISARAPSRTRQITMSVTYNFILVGPQYGSCFLSPWNVEFGGGSQIFGKCVHSCLIDRLKRRVIEMSNETPT